jgi:hypothetical protein
MVIISIPNPYWRRYVTNPCIFVGEWIYFLLFMAYIAFVTVRYGKLTRYEAA